MPDSAEQFWRSLHGEFEELAREEWTHNPQNRPGPGGPFVPGPGRWLFAFSVPGPPNHPEVFDLSDGLNDGFRERFKVDATRAGLKLGPPKVDEPWVVWLRHIFQVSREQKPKSKFLSYVDNPDESGHTSRSWIIFPVCEASASCCLQLQRAAIEQSNLKKTTRAVAVTRSPTPKLRRLFANDLKSALKTFHFFAIQSNAAEARDARRGRHFQTDSTDVAVFLRPYADTWAHKKCEALETCFSQLLQAANKYPTALPTTESHPTIWVHNTVKQSDSA